MEERNAENFMRLLSGNKKEHKTEQKQYKCAFIKLYVCWQWVDNVHI